MAKSKTLNCVFILALFLCVYTFNPNSKENFLSSDKPTPTSLMELLEREDGNTAATTMENNGYLFYGYNLYTGNPHSTEGSIDPGFTNPIFQSAYRDNVLTGDLRFKIPDGSLFGKNIGCDVALSSSSVKDVSSYRKSLETEVSGSASFGVGSFSASASFKSVLEGTSSSEDMYVESKADCRVFSGHIDYYRPPQLHPTLVKAIDYIDDKDFAKSKDDFFTFINYFGTHYIHELNMGARYGYLEKTTVSEFSSGNFISAGVSVSGSYGVGSASAKVSGETDNKNSGSKNKKDVKAFSIGASPPADGNPFTWAQKAIQEPMPIKYSVTDIREIFTNPLFNLDQLKSKDVKIDLEKFKKSLDQALKSYCAEYLKPQGLTTFCTHQEFDKVIKDLSNNPIKVKIEDGALFRLKNTFTQQCLTYNGFNKKLIVDSCAKDGQVWKLMNVPKMQAFRVLTNGPLSNGQWDYASGENRLYVAEYRDDTNDNRHFRFIQNADGTYFIKTKSNEDCIQVISSTNNEIHKWSCNLESSKWVILAK